MDCTNEAYDLSPRFDHTSSELSGCIRGLFFIFCSRGIFVVLYNQVFVN